MLKLESSRRNKCVWSERNARKEPFVEKKVAKRWFCTDDRRIGPFIANHR